MQQLFADGFPKVHASSDDVYGQLRPPDNENDFPIQSAVGILLKVEDAHSTVEPSEFLRITELLIYAIKSAAGSVVFDESQTAESQSSSNKNDERTAFFALPLSSDLLYIPPVPKSLPDEPEKVQSGGPLSASSGGRDRLSTLFDEASDRRKKARRKGGQSIGLAASRGAAAPRLSNPAIKVEEDDSAVITAKFTKATSLASDVVSQSSRPASRRSMSIAPAAPRPSSAGVNEVADAYTAETSTDPDVFIDTSFEARNKAAISRTVMACMRMHGFQQQKRRSTTAADTKIEDHDDEMGDLPGDAVTEDAEIRAAKDAEFKALYHQAYKGAAFAFVSHAVTQLLLLSKLIGNRETF